MSQLEIRVLDERSAAGLVACIHRCYGTSYPGSDFLDASVLTREVHAGRLAGRVAVTGSGRVVAHLGARFDVPGDCVADTVAGFVDPAYRGRHLLRDLGAAMSREFQERSLAGLRSYATGAHTRTQNMIVAAGGHVTGILLGHIPSGTEYRGIGHGFGAARIGAVVFYQSFRPMSPLRVSLPERWRDLVESMYREIGLDRVLEPVGRGEKPVGGLRLDLRQGVATIRLGGGDQPLERLLEALPDPDVEVAYVDVPLAAEARVGEIAGELLAERGFVFGALLPGSHASEVLRLQRVDPMRIAPAQIQLVSSTPASLLRRIVDEVTLAPLGGV